MSDQRGHGRVAVSVDIQVRAVGSTRWSAATLREISRGGCRLLAKEGVGRADDEIEIWLPSKRDSGLTVSANVLRVGAEHGANLVIAKFRPRDPDEQAGLQWVCAVLLSRSGGGRRADVRVAYRLDIRYGNDAELAGILEDISRNGFLMLSVKTVPDLYQSVWVVITAPDNSLFSLRACVMRRERVSTESGPGHLVGLQFDRIAADDEQRITELLYSLVVTD